MGALVGVSLGDALGCWLLVGTALGALLTLGAALSVGCCVGGNVVGACVRGPTEASAKASIPGILFPLPPY